MARSKTQQPRLDMFGDKLPQPSEAILEKIAHQKLTLGYNIKKNNRCDKCYTFKSNNGVCMCD